jgi:hypothetical protein
MPVKFLSIKASGIMNLSSTPSIVYCQRVVGGGGGGACVLKLYTRLAAPEPTPFFALIAMVYAVLGVKPVSWNVPGVAGAPVQEPPLSW